MSQELTINDLIELEAYAEALRKKAASVREKMQGIEKRKSKVNSAAISAAVDAHFEKSRLRSKMRFEANKKAPSGN